MKPHPTPLNRKIKGYGLWLSDNLKAIILSHTPVQCSSIVLTADGHTAA